MNNLVRSHHDLCFYAASDNEPKIRFWPYDLRRLFIADKFKISKKHGFAFIRPVGP